MSGLSLSNSGRISVFWDRLRVERLFPDSERRQLSGSGISLGCLLDVS